MSCRHVRHYAFIIEQLHKQASNLANPAGWIGDNVFCGMLYLIAIPVQTMPFIQFGAW